MSGTSMATPQMSGICALILDALIKAHYINSNEVIPNTIPIQIQKLAAKYAYDNIIFNSKYYSNINNYINPSDSNNNQSDINGLCGRGLIQLDLVINDIINKTLKLTLLISE